MKPLFDIVSRSTEDTEAAGETLCRLLLSGDTGIAKPDFVALYGELGEGKTAFVRGMAKIAAPDARVTSPTYSIINVYEGEKKLYHLDLYRIKSEDDLYSVGFYELFDDPDCIIAAEWCENIPYALPESYISVKLTHISDSARRIIVTLC